MAAPNPRSLDALLTREGSQLKRLTAEATRLTRLRDQVRRQLPAALAPHCLGAELQAGTLVIYMDSAATATPIRYQQRELLAKLAVDEVRCAALQVRVLPEPPGLPAVRSAPRELPDAVRQILETTAAGLDAGALSNSLRHLARNRKPRS